MGQQDYCSPELEIGLRPIFHENYGWYTDYMIEMGSRFWSKKWTIKLTMRITDSPSFWKRTIGYVSKNFLLSLQNDTAL
jgi:hypothetical protein